MATYSDYFEVRTSYRLQLIVTENSYDAAANTSSVTCGVYLNPPSGGTAYNLYSSQNSYSFNFNGTTYSGNFTYDFRSSDATKTVRTATHTISHDTSGNKSIPVSASMTIDSTDDAAIGTQTFALTSLPGKPTAAPTLTRASTGTTITVESATSGTTATVTDYEYQQSINGSTWGSAVSMGTDRTIDVTGLTSTQTYYYQTRVRTADGVGAWSATASVIGVPGAPASITPTRTNKDVAVVAGNATGTITGYYAQYSNDDGSTWSTAVAMTSQAYTYEDLTPGQTYLFRVYATNSIGNSAYTTSTGVFVPAGGKRWDGSAWTYTSTAKRWDGSAWVDLATAKRWDGSAWVDLS